MKLYKGDPLCYDYVMKVLQSDEVSDFLANCILSSLTLNGYDIWDIIYKLSKTVSMDKASEGEYTPDSFLSDEEYDRFIWSYLKGDHPETCLDYYARFDPQKTQCRMCPYSADYVNDLIEEECTVIRGFLQAPGDNEWILAVGLSEKSFSGVAGICDSDSRPPRLFGFTAVIWQHISSHPEMTRESSEVAIGRIKTRLEEALNGLNVDAGVAESLLRKMSMDKHVESEELFECCNRLLVRQDASGRKTDQEDGFRYALPEELRNRFRQFDLEEEEKHREAERIALEEARRKERQKEELQRQETEKTGGVNKRTGEEYIKIPITQRVEVADREGKRHTEKEQKTARHARSDIKEVVRRPYDWERMPYQGSRIIVPKVSNEEIYFYAADGKTQEQLLSRFKAKIDDTSQKGGYDWMAMEYIETEDDEAVIVYDIVTDCCYKYDLKDEYEAEVLRETLEGEDCMIICYMPFVLVSKLRRKGIYLKKLCSIYSLSEVMIPGHAIPMWQVLRGYGAKEWHRIINFKKEHDVSTVMQYLSSYGQVWDNAQKEIEQKGKVNEAKYQMLHDVILAHFFDTESGKPYLLRSAGNYWYSSKVDRQPGMRAWQLKITKAESGMPDCCLLLNALQVLINSERMRKTDWNVRRLEGNGFTTLLPETCEEDMVEEMISDEYENEPLFLNVDFQVEPIPYDSLRETKTEKASKGSHQENRLRRVLGNIVSLCRKNAVGLRRENDV